MYNASFENSLQLQSATGFRSATPAISSNVSEPPSASQTPLNTNGQVPQLWMGELDQRWDEPTIKQIWTNLLTPLGIVVHSIKLIKDKQSAQLGLANAGYCFIRFHNFEDASKVLNTFNGKVIPGTNSQHYFRLNWSSANIQAAAQAAAVASSIPLTSTTSPIEYSIFVGDLPQNINEQILLQTFKSKYPSCTSVKIMVDQTTGNIKGYGFVKFLNEEEQKRALIEMQGFVLLGRAIRVSTASKSNSSSVNVKASANASINSASESNLKTLAGVNGSSASLASSTHQATNPSSMLSAGASVDPATFASNSIMQPLPQNAPLQYFNDPSNTTVFIGGLNAPFSEKQMYDLFSKFGQISYVKIPQGKNCGFVQFYHRSSAEMAINEMQGFDIGGGCKIRVSWGARAAQRSWFARQLQMQQGQGQGQPQGQSSPQQHSQVPSQVQNQQMLNQYSSMPAQSSLSNFDSNNDINALLNMAKNQSMANNLGLFDSYLEDPIAKATAGLSNSSVSPSGSVNGSGAGYAVDQYAFQNESIPFNATASNGKNMNYLNNLSLDNMGNMSGYGGMNSFNMNVNGGGMNGVNNLGMNSMGMNNMGMNNMGMNTVGISPDDELKLNKLLLAARDGNLDQLDLASNLYK